MKPLFRLALCLSITAGALAPAWADDLRIGSKRETSSMDPHFSTLLSNINWVGQVFDQLIEFGPNMELQPGLATSWEHTDDKTWIIKLRQNVKFQDGSAFTADDVIYTWQRLPELAFAPDPVVQYIRGKNIEKIDDYTLKITTSRPNPTLPNDMAQVFIIPRSNKGMKTEDYNSGKAAHGTGPYSLGEFVPGDHLTLVANPNWWGGKPKWDHVIVKPIASDPSRVAALLAGQVDIIDYVPTEDLDSLKKNPKVAISSGPTNRPLFLNIDSNRDISPNVLGDDGKPMFPNPLRDWRVRKAFAKVIDRQAIVARIMEGNAVVTTQFVPKGLFGFNPDIQVEKPDVTGAKKLMAEAGYANGFHLKLDATTGQYVNDSKIAQAVAQMLSQIGVKTELVLYPIAVYYNRQTEHKEYSVFLGSHNESTGEPSAQLDHVIHTTWPNTEYCCIPRGYSNPRIDDIIEKGNATMDDKARDALYQQAIGAAVDDVGIIFLHLQTNNWATRPGLSYKNRMDETTYPEYVDKTK